MRVVRFFVSVSFSSLLSISVAARQTASSDAQALQLLQQSLSALSGGQTLSDVTLSGTARRIAGSDDESGTGVLKAIPGAGRMDLALSGGQVSEVENLTGTTPTGSWSGPDGVSHAMAFHNLLTEPAWFFPAFAIARRLSAPQNFIASYIGAEIRNGQAVQHISLSQPPPFTEPPGGLSLTRLSQIDIFLDSNTFLPAAATLNIHPDNNALLDIPIEIRFSDYRSVNGGQIPFHVERVLNNGLILDLEFQTATLNSGLSPTEFR